jgi:hypothetical protein
MKDEARQLRRELKCYRFRLRSNTDPRTVKVLRALMVQIEARLRQFANHNAQLEQRREADSLAVDLQVQPSTERASLARHPDTRDASPAGSTSMR